jgi:hypothetical protein
MGETALGIPYPDSTDNYRPDDDMQALAEEVDALITAAPGTWAAYTPTWGTSGTAPALGNGTIVGRYIQVGKKVRAEILVTFGSTTTFGTGGYTFTLPVAASASPNHVGSVYLRDTSGTSTGHYVGIAVIQGSLSTTTLNIFEGSAHAQVQPAVPVTWANTDFWSISIEYEVP